MLAKSLIKDPIGLRWYGAAVLYAVGLYFAPRIAAQLRLYHGNRVRRVNDPQPDDYPQRTAYLAAAQSGNAPVGGNAASFLTSF